jgi:hypothetical protein
MLQAILSPVKVVSHTAAQVVAAFGTVDVQQSQWENLLPALLSFVTSPEVHLLYSVLVICVMKWILHQFPRI